MTGILHLHHEACWWYQYEEAPATPSGKGALRHVNDGCTLRLDVAPQKGGNRALQRFLAAEQALGLRAGLYTNYADYYPLNSLFFSDRTILQPDGSRQRAWVHSYKMKPSLAVEYDAWFAPRIAHRFHPDTAYTDVHTCIPPWYRVDYDERVPGAGTFAATYYSDGELLLNDQRHYCGPVFSEGGCHWIYAGLVSGNYGQIGVRRNDPPDPTFNLLKIHPLETDIGLCVGADVKTGEWITGGDDLDAQVDRYLLAILTFGHIAYLPESPSDIRLLLRVYHMARAVSSRCAGIKPSGIHYADEDGRWLTVSEAHARGLERLNRIRIRYPGDMVYYANWSQTGTWVLNGTSAGEALLPPNGYLLDTPRGFLCASMMRNGARCDRAEMSDGWFVDGRGKEVRFGPLAASGSAALLIDAAAPSLRRVIDGGGNTTIGVGRDHAPRRYRAVAADGTVIAAGRKARTEGEYCVIEAVPGAARYEWRPGAPPRR